MTVASYITGRANAEEVEGVHGNRLRGSLDTLRLFHFQASMRRIISMVTMPSYLYPNPADKVYLPLPPPLPLPGLRCVPRDAYTLALFSLSVSVSLHPP